jgi:hypothetical protein
VRTGPCLPVVIWWLQKGKVDDSLWKASALAEGQVRMLMVGSWGGGQRGECESVSVFLSLCVSVCWLVKGVVLDVGLSLFISSL